MGKTKPSKIYLACFTVNNSVFAGDVIGYAIAEDGKGLASHLSSNETWARHDMGLTSDWKHDIYQEEYPKGYALIWIDNPATDTRWQDALAKNKALEALEKEVKNG